MDEWMDGWMDGSMSGVGEWVVSGWMTDVTEWVDG